MGFPTALHCTALRIRWEGNGAESRRDKNKNDDGNGDEEENGEE